MRFLNAVAAPLLTAIFFAASVSRAGEPAAAPSPTDQRPAEVAPPAQTAPRALRWHEGEPIPPGYRRSTEIHTGCVISGAITFGTAWLPLAIFGSVRGATGGLYASAAIPVVGPFLFLSDISHLDGGNVLFNGLLVMDGIQQAVGLGLVVAGLAWQRPVLVPTDVKAAKTRWLPTPMSFGKGSVGLGFVGTM